MSALDDALAGLEDLCGAHLPGWAMHRGFHLLVSTPGVIVGLPLAVEFGVTPKGRARLTIPITGVVDVTAADPLIEFMSPDGLAQILSGAEHQGWWGQAVVGDYGTPRTAPNGTAESLAVDLTVTIHI